MADPPQKSVEENQKLGVGVTKVAKILKGKAGTHPTPKMTTYYMLALNSI